MTFEYHDNEVDISLSDELTDSGYKMVKGGYKIDSYIVTPGQDPNNNMGMYTTLNQSWTGEEGKLIYRLGRHASNDVDIWFNSKVTFNETSLGYPYGHVQHAPSGNFAFSGMFSLTLTGGALYNSEETYQFSDFIISQDGGDDTRNLWVVGATYCQYVNNIGYISGSEFNVWCNNVHGVHGSGSRIFISVLSSYDVKIERIEYPFPQSIK